MVLVTRDGRASWAWGGIPARRFPRLPAGGANRIAWPIARDDANSSAAPNAPTGLQRPTIIAARPMNPRPAVMFAWKEVVSSMLRYAPPSAARAPDTITFR